MASHWITNGSTSSAPVINPLAAACRAGYAPTHIHLLDNPAIAAVTEEVTSLGKTVVTAHGGDEPEISVTTIEDETDFPAIITYLTNAIETAQTADAEVAVDVTPGRKFWSIISFRAGLRYEVDHLYYIHVKSDDYFGQVYPTIPRPAVELVDFVEVI